MNATQTLEIYKILNQYFKNEDHATKIVEDIQQIIDNKFDEKKDVLASKEDIMRLENKLNDQLKWLMATMIAVGGFIIAVIKLT
jgi:ArsR family metal-binding transcriptional regulator